MVGEVNESLIRALTYNMDASPQPRKLNEGLRGLLVCPITKQNLLPAPEEVSLALFQAFEKAFEARGDKRLGESDAEGDAPGISAERVDFLVTKNQRWAYPVVDGVPWLLESEQLSVQE